MHNGFYAVKRSCSKDIEQKQNSDSVTNKQNMEDSNPTIYLINIYTFTKFGEIYPFFLKLLCRNKILSPLKGHKQILSK